MQKQAAAVVLAAHGTIQKKKEPWIISQHVRGHDLNPIGGYQNVTAPQQSEIPLLAAALVALPLPLTSAYGAHLLSPQSLPTVRSSFLDLHMSRLLAHLPHPAIRWTQENRVFKSWTTIINQHWYQNGNQKPSHKYFSNKKIDGFWRDEHFIKRVH